MASKKYASATIHNLIDEWANIYHNSLGISSNSLTRIVLMEKMIPEVVGGKPGFNWLNDDEDFSYIGTWNL